MWAFDSAEAWIRVLMIFDTLSRPEACSAEAWIRPFQTAGYQWALPVSKGNDHQQAKARFNMPVWPP